MKSEETFAPTDGDRQLRWSNAQLDRRLSEWEREEEKERERERERERAISAAGAKARSLFKPAVTDDSLPHTGNLDLISSPSSSASPQRKSNA